MDVDARFEILDKIGAGSFATVYRARDTELGREVAVKQIHQQYLDDPALLERYWAEAQLLASLHHPNVVTIFDIVRPRGWLIMELMQASLKDRLAGRQMDLRSLRSTLAHCLRALKYLHSRGVIHGDIKPGNLMIDHRRRIKIGDFGLARRVSDEDGSLIKGTTKYMAPELVSDEFGEVGPASDLYSLGFSAYELMCGPNFEDLFPGLSAFGRDKQAAWMMWHAAPDRRLPEIGRVLEGVPPDLAKVIQRLCEKDPAVRYATADEALSDLNIDVKLVKTGGGDDDLGESLDAPAVDTKRRRMLIGVCAASVLMSLLMLFLPTNKTRHVGPARTTVGVVRAVDPDANSLEIEGFDGIPEEIVLSDRPKILFLNEQKNVLLKRIEPGDWVEIDRSAGAAGAQVIALKVARPMSGEGVIHRVDASAGEVTVALRNTAVGDEVVLQTTPQSMLTVNGREAPLRDFKPDDAVTVRYVHDPAGRGGVLLSSLAALRAVERVGFVREVDPDKREIAVSDARESGAVQRLPLAEGATITLDSGEPLPLAELRTGDRVRLTVDEQIRTVVVSRDAMQFSGLLASADERNGVFVVTGEDGRRLTFDLTEGGGVRLGLEPATLADLRSGIDRATVGYEEQANGTLLAHAVDVHRGVRHDRWAILIATETYNDASLSPLPYAIDDARHVYESLTRRYAVDPAWTAPLYDENLKEVQAGVRKVLEGAGTRAQMIVYVMGRAYLGEDDRVYIACKDFQLADMPGTGLSLDWLLEQVEAYESAEKLLLLDIVHEGRGQDIDRQPDLPTLLEKLAVAPHTTVLIGGSAAGERGGFLSDRGHGVFADVLSRAFDGAADTDRDLHIDAEELFDALEQGFVDVALPQGKTLTPLRVPEP